MTPVENFRTGIESAYRTALFCASANGGQAVADAIKSFFVLESFNVKNSNLIITFLFFF